MKGQPAKRFRDGAGRSAPSARRAKRVRLVANSTPRFQQTSDWLESRCRSLDHEVWRSTFETIRARSIQTPVSWCFMLALPGLAHLPFGVSGGIEPRHSAHRTVSANAGRMLRRLRADVGIRARGQERAFGAGNVASARNANVYVDTRSTVRRAPSFQPLRRACHDCFCGLVRWGSSAARLERLSRRQRAVAKGQCDKLATVDRRYGDGDAVETRDARDDDPSRRRAARSAPASGRRDDRRAGRRHRGAVGHGKAHRGSRRRRVLCVEPVARSQEPGKVPATYLVIRVVPTTCRRRRWKGTMITRETYFGDLAIARARCCICHRVSRRCGATSCDPARERLAGFAGEVRPVHPLGPYAIPAGQ